MSDSDSITDESGPAQPAAFALESGQAAPSAQPAAFALESGQAAPSARAAVRRKTAETFQCRIGVYCQRYGTRRPDGSVKPLDRKTVERWIRRGREVENGPDFPPLDHPELMAEWWRRCMVHRVPEVFASLEEGERKGPGEKERPADDGDEISPADGEAARQAFERSRRAAEKAGLGFEASLERVRQAERLAFFQWQTVQIEPEKHAASVIDRRKKAWESAQSVLIRAEKEAEKIMDRSSEWARWEDVERETGLRLGVVNTGVRSLVARVATKITLPPGLFDSLNAAFQAEVDSLFSGMAAGGFAPALELSAE